MKVICMACLAHGYHGKDKKKVKGCKKKKGCEQNTMHVPRLLSNQNTPWHVIFWYFHKLVLLLACPPAFVTSVWLQQSPFMSWLCLLNFVWLTSGLCLPAGHRLTLSSTSLPGRPVNEVSVPPSLVRGRHPGLYNTLCRLPWKTTVKTDIMNRVRQVLWGCKISFEML